MLRPDGCTTAQLMQGAGVSRLAAFRTLRHLEDTRADVTRSGEGRGRNPHVWRWHPASTVAQKTNDQNTERN
jgi:hypothetical protein